MLERTMSGTTFSNLRKGILNDLRAQVYTAIVEFYKEPAIVVTHYQEYIKLKRAFKEGNMLPEQAISATVFSRGYKAARKGVLGDMNKPGHVAVVSFCGEPDLVILPHKYYLAIKAAYEASLGVKGQGNSPSAK
jgi:hypothetical protein